MPLIIMMFTLIGCYQKQDLAGQKADENTRAQALRAAIEKIYFNTKTNDFPEIKDLSASEAHKFLNDPNVVFVDTRFAYEREVSVIPGSISEESFYKSFEEHKNKKIIAYCTVGKRSGDFVKNLMEEDSLNNAFNLRGGVLMWSHVKGKFVDLSGKSVKKVHVFGKTWNLLHPHYEPVL